MRFLSQKLQTEEQTKPRISVEEAKELLELAPCTHCGYLHHIACPRIKRIVFVGTDAKEVEFWENWPHENVIDPAFLQEIVDNAEQHNS